MPRGKPYPPEFKAKVSLEAMEGGATVNEIAAKYDLNPNLLRNWKAKAESAERDRLRRRVLAHYGIDLDSEGGAGGPK